jgi:uncharacterized LabA/DUF88 family protein
MDGEIIHYIHTIGKKYARVVLISGDSDMKPAMDYIRDNYGVETWVVAHKESMSNLYRNGNFVLIEDIL